MTLSPGTALLHGTYVLDAWYADDDLGTLYLATHIPTGQWVPVRRLGRGDAACPPPAAERQQLMAYWRTVTAQSRPELGLRLDGFEDGDGVYQVWSLDERRSLGQPLARLAPLSVATVVPLIRQLTALLQGMKPLGWYGLRVSPEQIWLHPAAPDRLTFTGFGWPVPSQAGNQAWEPNAEAELVRQGSRVLYFALTGLRPEATRAPLEVDLHHRHPDLPSALFQALEYGLQAEDSAILMARWQGLLSMAAPRVLSAMPMPAPVVPREVPRRRLIYQGLGLTAGAASLAGGTLGLHLRLQPYPSVAQPPLSPKQAFPPRSDWPGQAGPATVDSDFPRRLERYGDAPPPPAPAVTAPLDPVPPLTPAVPLPIEPARPDGFAPEPDWDEPVAPSFSDPMEPDDTAPPAPLLPPVSTPTPTPSVPRDNTPPLPIAPLPANPGPTAPAQMAPGPTAPAPAPPAPTPTAPTPTAPAPTPTAPANSA